MISPVAAELLANHLRFKHASVNLIPANPVPEKGFERPSKKVVEAFLKVLQKHKINATVRREMGKDIDAAWWTAARQVCPRAAGLKAAALSVTKTDISYKVRRFVNVRYQ